MTKCSDRYEMAETVMELFEGLRGKPFSVAEGKALAEVIDGLPLEKLDTLPDVVREVCESQSHPKVAHLSAALRGQTTGRKRPPTRAEAEQRFTLLAEVKRFLRELATRSCPGTKLRHLEFLIDRGNGVQLTIAPAEGADDSWYVYYHDPAAVMPEGYGVGMDIRACTLNQSCMAGDFWRGVVRGGTPVEVIPGDYQGIENRARQRCEVLAAQGTLKGAP